jgi:hypothetical protein
MSKKNKMPDNEIIAEIEKVLSEFDDLELRDKFLKDLIKDLNESEN